MNTAAWVQGNTPNRVDPTGLFDWCTGRIEQGDTLGKIYVAVSPPLDIQYVMRSIGAANVGHPIYGAGIGDYNIRINALQPLDPSWPSLNIPSDILAQAVGTACNTPQTSTPAPCNCDSGYVWRPDWQRCVPIIPSAPPAAPYVEFDMNKFYEDSPCSKYLDLARRAGVFNEVDAVLTSGRFPSNLNVPPDVERQLYQAYNDCMVNVFEKTGTVKACNMVGPAISITLDILSLVPHTTVVATVASLLIGVAQVASDMNDIEAVQGLNRALGGSLSLPQVVTILDRVGGVNLANFGRVMGPIFAIGDGFTNFVTVMDDCFA